MQILSERLRLLRAKKGVSQIKAAQSLNLSNTTLSNYELNVSSPTPETLVNMASYYHTTTDYLLGITNNPIGATQQGVDLDAETVFKICSLPLARKHLVISLVDLLTEN